MTITPTPDHVGTTLRAVLRPGPWNPTGTRLEITGVVASVTPSMSRVTFEADHAPRYWANPNVWDFYEVPSA